MSVQVFSLRYYRNVFSNNFKSIPEKILKPPGKDIHCFRHLISIVRIYVQEKSYPLTVNLEISIALNFSLFFCR